MSRQRSNQLSYSPESRAYNTDLFYQCKRFVEKILFFSSLARLMGLQLNLTVMQQGGITGIAPYVGQNGVVVYCSSALTGFRGNFTVDYNLK